MFNKIPFHIVFNDAKGDFKFYDIILIDKERGIRPTAIRATSPSNPSDNFHKAK